MGCMQEKKGEAPGALTRVDASFIPGIDRDFTITAWIISLAPGLSVRIVDALILVLLPQPQSRRRYRDPVHRLAIMAAARRR
jgi:hypothetical protein